MKPKIVIRYGGLLEPFFKPYIEQKYPSHTFLTPEEVTEKVKLFQEEWSKYEDVFIEGLEKIDLRFQRNRIDVFIIAATTRDMSAPLIIRARYSPEEFISVLCHELIHNLLVDLEVKMEYGEETKRTRNHIYTFAIMEYIFREIFNEPERLEVEKSKSSATENEEYYMAWQIVGEAGYESIIEKICVPK